MGFSCINKNGELIVSQEVIEKTNLLRSSGLSNVYNMNPEAIFCTEVFEGPEYYVTGATMLITGLTQTLTGCTTGTTAVYNLTYTPEFDVSFIITGGTKYTGYTGSFCYKIFSDNQFSVNGPIRGLVDGTEFINNCFAFSAITSTTLTQQFLEGSLSNTWVQYMIRPYYTFVSKECSPGLYFDTWKSTTQLNLISDTDFYFMTVVDPPVPILEGPSSPPPQLGFITDIILRGPDGITTNPTGPQALNGELNYFNLTNTPTSLNSVLVFVNGVQMAPNFDYQLFNYGGFGVPPTLVFQGVEIKNTDWIVAYYPFGNQISNITPFWSVENFKVDSSNFVVDIGDPGFGVNYVNFNTITSRQEIFTRVGIGDGTPIVFVNGTQLAFNYQIFKSSTIPNRFILNEALIHTGDIISIFYNASILETNDYGSLLEPNFTVTWFTPGGLNKIEGKFFVNVYDKNDVSNTIMYQQTINYVSDQSSYTVTINNLALDFDYRFEVIFETTYTGYKDNKVITCSQAEGYFNTKGPINYTY